MPGRTCACGQPVPRWTGDTCPACILRDLAHLGATGWAEPTASGQRRVRVACAECGTDGVVRCVDLCRRWVPWRCHPCGCRRGTERDGERRNVVYLVAGGGLAKAGVSYAERLDRRLADHRRDGLPHVLALFDVGGHYAAEVPTVAALRSGWTPCQPGDTRHYTEAAHVPRSDWPACVDLVTAVVLAEVPDAVALDLPADSIAAAA